MSVSLSDHARSALRWTFRGVFAVTLDLRRLVVVRVSRGALHTGMDFRWFLLSHLISWMFLDLLMSHWMFCILRVAPPTGVDLSWSLLPSTARCRSLMIASPCGRCCAKTKPWPTFQKVSQLMVFQGPTKQTLHDSLNFTVTCMWLLLRSSFQKLGGWRVGGVKTA